MPPATAFNDIYQLGYVTADIAAAQAQFRSRYGVGDFLCYDVNQHMITPQGEGNVALRLGFAFIGEIQIELIQPLAGLTRIYTDVLDRSAAPMAFHHAAIVLKGSLADWDAFRAGLTASPRPVVLEGAVGDDVRFVYTDETAILGHHMEYLWFSADARQGQAGIPRY